MTELLCPACGLWSAESDWIETEVSCEDCGSHPALCCPQCGDCHDQVFVDLKKRDRP